jgi:capsular polysaccharide biosynthesis protein
MQEINLYELLKHYAKYWVLILVFTLAGLISAIIYNSFIQKPIYKSNATLILISDSTSSTINNTTTINNYLDLLKSRRVLEPVIADLKLPVTYDQLSGSVSTSNDKDTEVLKLTITNRNPQTSKAEANDTINSFRTQVKALYNLDNIKVVDSASLATTPYNVHQTLQLLLSGVVGFLISIIIVFFIYDFNLNKTNTTLPTRIKNLKKQKPTRKSSESSSVVPPKSTVTARSPKVRSVPKKTAKTTSNTINKKKIDKKK